MKLKLIAVAALVFSVQAFAQTTIRINIPAVNIISMHTDCEGGINFNDQRWDDSISVRINGLGVCHTLGKATVIEYMPKFGQISFMGQSSYMGEEEVSKPTFIPFIKKTVVQKVRKSSEVGFASLNQLDMNPVMAKKFIENLKKGEFKHLIFTGDCTHVFECVLYDSIQSLKVVPK